MQKDRGQYYKQIEGMLYRYRDTIVSIKLLVLEIERVRDGYGGLSASSIDEITCATNKTSSPVENEVIKKERHLSGLYRRKRELEIEVEKVDNLLSVLNPDDYRLLELRYFRGHSFGKMADIMEKDDKYLIRKRTQIIEEKLIPVLLLKNSEKSTKNTPKRGCK